MDPWKAALSRESAEHLELLRALGPRSAIIAPVVARDRTVGVVTFVSTQPERRYGLPEFEIAQELAARAALALDNARLFRRLRRRRGREAILAIVSHDLRNPLGAIDLSAALLLRRTLADHPQARKRLEIIRRSAGRMEHLIRDLLDVAGRCRVCGRPCLEVEPGARQPRRWAPPARSEGGWGVKLQRRRRRAPRRRLFSTC